jgi:hypothetical protein
VLAPEVGDAQVNGLALLGSAVHWMQQRDGAVQAPATAWQALRCTPFPTTVGDMHSGDAKKRAPYWDTAKQVRLVHHRTIILKLHTANIRCSYRAMLLIIAAVLVMAVL